MTIQHDFYTFSKKWLSSIKKVSLLSVIAITLIGCEASLNLEGVEATLKQPIRRTDQLITMEVDPAGVITVLGSAGLVLTGTYTDGEMQWQRDRLGEGMPPNIIRSTTCADGTQVALSFGNEIWLRKDGEPWISMPVGTAEQVEDVTCRLDDEIWVSAAYSLILKTSDRGESWEEFSADEDATLSAIQFVTDDIGYAVGEFGLLLKTTDGGDNWEMLEPIGDDFYPLSVYFTNPSDGWVSGVLGIIWRTRDGGESWERQLVDSNASIYGFFEAYDRTFAFGDQGALLRFDGERWVDQPSPELPIHYSAATALGDGKVLLVGGFGLTMILPVIEAANSTNPGAAE